MKTSHQILETRLSAFELLSKEITHNIRVAWQNHDLYMVDELLAKKNQYNKKIGELRKAIS